MKSVRIFSHVTRDSVGYLETFLQRHGYPFEIVCLDEEVSVPQDLEALAGLVFMGGPGNVNEPADWMEGELRLIAQAAKKNLPMLGICLGAQLIAKALGGIVEPNYTLEVGWHSVFKQSKNNWFGQLPDIFEVFQWHAHTFSLPPGAVSLATNPCTKNQAFALGNILAMQFHLEMTEENIEYLIQRFASDIEQASSCVQTADELRRDLEARTKKLHLIADSVYEGWFQSVF